MVGSYRPAIATYMFYIAQSTCSDLNAVHLILASYFPAGFPHRTHGIKCHAISLQYIHAMEPYMYHVHLLATLYAHV